MPRRVDYAGRFEFLRQAAFAIVRDESVDALTRRRIAAELGCGLNTVRRLVDSRVDLVRLAADEVATRRRRGRWRRGGDDPRELAADLVRVFMPEDPTHLDEELVWLRLVAACSFRPSGLEVGGEVRREFQVAQLGYDDGLPVEPRPAPTRGAGSEDRRTAMERHLDAHHHSLAEAVDRMLDLIDAPEPRTDLAATAIAVIDGLTFAACLGRLTPERATDLAVAHVIGLSQPPHDAVRPAG